MEKLLAFRGLIAQLAFMAGLLYFAKMAPEMHVAIMTTLAGLGTMLVQRARNQAGDTGSNGSGGVDGSSIIPMRMKETRTVNISSNDPPRTPRFAVSILAGLTWTIFTLFAMALLLHCGQPAQTVATEVGAGVKVAQDVCQVVGVATADPLITLICPFLDKDGKTVPNTDGGIKMITVQIPRDTWVRMKDGGP